MLKSCWECIAGERLDNEMIVNPNDYSQKEGPEYNEIVFLLPRDLIYVQGSVVINGNLSPNRKSVRIGFMSGGINLVKKPLCFITIDFVGNEIIFENGENGSLNVEQRHKISGHSFDSDFKFIMKVKNNEGEINIGTMLEGYGFDDIRLLSESELQLQKDIFFSINKDTLKISHLDFIWT